MRSLHLCDNLDRLGVRIRIVDSWVRRWGGPGDACAIEVVRDARGEALEVWVDPVRVRSLRVARRISRRRAGVLEFGLSDGSVRRYLVGRNSDGRLRVRGQRPRRSEARVRRPHRRAASLVQRLASLVL